MSLKTFTLVELLLTITIMMIVMGIGVAWTFSGMARTELQVSVERLVSHLRTEQAKAMTNTEDRPHGMALDAHRFTIFAGTSLATAVSWETFDLPPSMTIQAILLNSGGSEIRFFQYSGETLQFGSFQLRHRDTADILTVTLSPLGLIQWQ